MEPSGGASSDGRRSSLEAPSVLDGLGAEILAIVSPVSVCMLLVVLLVRGLTHMAQLRMGLQWARWSITSAGETIKLGYGLL